MHRSGGKPPSAGSVSTPASPARLPATAGRSPSSAGPYRLPPISTAYERRGSGRRTAAAAPDEGATAHHHLDGAPPAHPARARPSSKANPAAVICSATAGSRKRPARSGWTPGVPCGRGPGRPADYRTVSGPGFRAVVGRRERQVGAASGGGPPHRYDVWGGRSEERRVGKGCRSGWTEETQ